MEYQRALNISLPKERSLENISKLKFFEKISFILDDFISGKENFFLICSKEFLTRSYFIKAAFNSYQNNSVYLNLNSFNFKKDPLKLDKKLLFVDGLSKEILSDDLELFLFNLFNKCVIDDKKMIISSVSSINELDIKLEDLKSRLNTIVPNELPHSADDEKRELIQLELSLRGLIIKKRELDYIFHHHTRNLDSLLTLADKLDRLSLEKKKSISINLIKDLI